MKNMNFTPSPKLTINPLIEMFHMCPVDPDNANVSVTFARQTISDGMTKGYLIDPKCTWYGSHFIDSVDMQYNSTFYKTWSDVTNKTRFELLIDQILHYMTTYGTDFSLGAGYVPNTNPEEPEWTSYKLIKSCTFEELYDKCVSMLCSGVALKSNTVTHLTKYIIEYCKFYDTDLSVQVDNIKNREAMIILCDALNIMPQHADKLFAHIVYKTTGKTMIVKNRAMRNTIAMNHATGDVLFNRLSIKQVEALSEIFNRYKPLFLAFKNKNTASVINRISRLSKKNHKPMKIGFWEQILNMRLDDIMKEPNLDKYMNEVSNFKLVQLMQAIRERLFIAADNAENLYIIRNGKIFVKEGPAVSLDNCRARLTELSTLHKMLWDRLVTNLANKKCAVKFPEKYELTCPTSEKNFIGDIPMGTSCALGNESVIGIYWKNSWGTRDFDLSYEDVNGNRISWCTNYMAQDATVIYSGDMTNAPNGANEVIKFVTNKIINGIVSVNRYSGNAGSRYRLYFGTDHNVTGFNNVDMQKYMVDPNNISLEAEITQEESAQQTLGVILDGRFYFYSLSTGYGPVKTALYVKNTKVNERPSYKAKNNVGDELIKILQRKTNSLLSLKQVMLDAGFWEATNDDTEVLDLTMLDRNTIIDLFSK